MSYDPEITETAAKNAKKKLDRSLIDHFNKKVLKIAENPRAFAKPLRGPLAGTWETYLEHGWRILYDIDETRKVVTITDVKHKDEF